jgi:hypothetical protein
VILQYLEKSRLAIILHDVAAAKLKATERKSHALQGIKSGRNDRRLADTVMALAGKARTEDLPVTLVRDSALESSE